MRQHDLLMAQDKQAAQPVCSISECSRRPQMPALSAQRRKLSAASRTGPDLWELRRRRDTKPEQYAEGAEVDLSGSCANDKQVVSQMRGSRRWQQAKSGSGTNQLHQLDSYSGLPPARMAQTFVAWQNSIRPRTSAGL